MYTPLKYPSGEDFPMWAEYFGFFLSSCSMLCIPAYAIYYLFFKKSDLTFKEVSKQSFTNLQPDSKTEAQSNTFETVVLRHNSHFRKFTRASILPRIWASPNDLTQLKRKWNSSINRMFEITMITNNPPSRDSTPGSLPHCSLHSNLRYFFCDSFIKTDFTYQSKIPLTS